MQRVVLHLARSVLQAHIREVLDNHFVTTALQERIVAAMVRVLVGRQLVQTAPQVNTVRRRQHLAHHAQQVIPLVARPHVHRVAQDIIYLRGEPHAQPVVQATPVQRIHSLAVFVPLERMQHQVLHVRPALQAPILALRVRDLARSALRALRRLRLVKHLQQPV